MNKPLVLGGAVFIAGIIAIGTITFLNSRPITPQTPPHHGPAPTATPPAPPPAVSTPFISPSSIITTDLTKNFNLGLNFFIFQGGKNLKFNSARALSAASTATDMKALGASVVRQLTNGDVAWDTVEPTEGVWNWTITDDALKTLPATTQPIMTLFSMQYASPNAPWKTTGTFEKTMTTEAETYIRTVVGRYKDQITYWEIGNEMDHWRASAPGELEKVKKILGSEKLPKLMPTDEYTPEDQGKFFAAAAAIIREVDSNAVVVMPGIAAIESYQANVWLPGFVKGAGTSTFDVVNYHDYSSWDGMQGRIDILKKEMTTLGISSKPIWLTETGSTTDGTLAIRTNYPNSTITQAADVLRRSLMAFSNDIPLVLWHTYFSSPSQNETNAWRGYGLRDENGNHSPSYDMYAALGAYFPATSVENLSTASEEFIMKITAETGKIAYVTWGNSGSWTVPTGVTKESIPVDTELSDSIVTAGTSIKLGTIPQIFRE